MYEKQVTIRMTNEMYEELKQFARLRYFSNIQSYVRDIFRMQIGFKKDDLKKEQKV